MLIYRTTEFALNMRVVTVVKLTPDIFKFSSLPIKFIKMVLSFCTKFLSSLFDQMINLLGTALVRKQLLCCCCFEPIQSV